MRIDACFDSHVHWAFTGEVADRLKLSELTTPADVRQLELSPHHRRGDWILGFGWDDSKWEQRPHRQILDEWQPDKPVAFSRCDGHAIWLNTEGLKRTGFWSLTEEIPGGRIERDADGRPTGILIEKAADLVRTALPRPTPMETRRHLLKGVQIFNEAGYTHIRDMTCDENQWNEAVKLDESGLLTLAVEEYFWLKSLADLNEMVSLVIRARRSQTKNLRAMGLKVFFDGALGSEGAYLSRCYHGTDNKGLLLWDQEEFSTVLRRCWEEGIEAAVHVIGDEAADLVVQAAWRLKEQGHQGLLHLEHCELLRPDTVKKMRELKVICHLQPSHWLSDRAWLNEKLGPLAQDAFPWRRLQESGIEFDFGSDAPIEPASISRLLQALRESPDHGIPRLLGQPESHMSHRDLSWAPNSFTLLDGDTPNHVVFRGEHLL